MENLTESQKAFLAKRQKWADSKKRVVTITKTSGGIGDLIIKGLVDGRLTLKDIAKI